MNGVMRLSVMTLVIVGSLAQAFVLFNAADDWIAPSTRLDVGPYDDMPNVARVQTRVGGHLGWIDGFGLDRRRGGHCKWIVDATVRLVNGALGGWWWSANG